EYWYRNLRETVRFSDAIESLINDDHTRFIEVSPHPVLTVAIEEIADTRNVKTVVVGSLRRDHGDFEEFVLSMAAAFVQGVPVRWERAFAGAGRADLPTYAFQHQRYWLNVTNSPATSPAELGQASADHPLMGAAVELADTDGIVFTGRLSLATQP